MSAPENGAILIKKIGRGLQMISAGERSKSFFVLKSGAANVLHGKSELVELYPCREGQVIGEESVFAPGAAGTTVVTLKDCEAIEIQSDAAKAQIEQSHPMLKLLIKALAERTKAALNELKNLKQAEGAFPCPPNDTAKVFGVIFHAARFVGEECEEGIRVRWTPFSEYASEVFDEPLQRLEEAVNVLVKLGYAEITLEQAGGQTSISEIVFNNMSQIETFFDFYQNYFFKSGYASYLKTNDKITQVTKTFVELSHDYEPDRSGMVQMPFKDTIDRMKEKLGKTFESDQLFRLEQKGLMIKRITTNDGGVLAFYRSEFEQMLLNWKVVREVENWNQKGFVDLQVTGKIKDQEIQSAAPDQGAETPSTRTAGPDEADDNGWKPLALRGALPRIRLEPPKPGELLCPTCMSGITEKQTVCEICDSELKRSA